MTGNALTWKGPEYVDFSPYLGADVAPRRGFEEANGFQIISQVTVEEDGDDELMITEHPIQRGALMTDHAFKRPSELRVRMGWSSAWLADAGSDTRQMYGTLLRLQAGRIPFTVYTGKRVYSNMLVAGLRTHTDEKMEFAFVADIHLREVVLVSTNVVGGGASYNAAAVRYPEVNTPQTEVGEMQAEPASLTDDQVQDYGGGGDAPEPATPALPPLNPPT